MEGLYLLPCFECILQWTMPLPKTASHMDLEELVRDCLLVILLQLDEPKLAHEIYFDHCGSGCFLRLRGISEYEIEFQCLKCTGR